jgi:hypothetical protein
MEKIINEKAILDTVKGAVHEAVLKTLSGYSSPFEVIVKDVITSHSAELREKVDTMLSGIFKDKDFNAILKQEFQHKVAKTLVAKLEGAIEKGVNSYQQDPTLRARMVLALEEIVNQNKQV